MIHQLTNPQVSSKIKDQARQLLAEYRGVILAYREDYDLFKYNGAAPLSPEKFETDARKWHYIELAKWYEEKLKTNTRVPRPEFTMFHSFVIGEGYKDVTKLDMANIQWISEFRNETGLSALYSDWTHERINRYDLLESQLNEMRKDCDLRTLQNFKWFITPKGLPPMWDIIGSNPIRRSQRSYVLSLQSFFLLDHYLHLLDTWDKVLAGEPAWDFDFQRLRVYRKIYTEIYPINTMTVRRVINDTLKFP